MNSSTLPTSGVSPPEEKIDVDKLVGSFVALRDRKRIMERQHKDSLKPFNDLMDEIGGKLLKHMQDNGVNSLSTSHGSAYQSTVPRATIKDAEAFKSFVITNQLYELVDWRANARATMDFIKNNNGTSPPGVNPSTFTTVGVRRPDEKVED